MDRKRILTLSLVGLLLLAAAFSAFKGRWVCDDIFITYRYVDNFLEGKGIVFNEGERVEGYTHFLWFLLLAAAQALGLDVIESSTILGVLSYLGTLVLFAWAGFRLQGRSGGLFLPFAALALALHQDFRLWATGGLETSFYTFLLSAAFVAWFFTPFQRSTRLILAGLFLNLAAMTRPDAALFFFLANGLLLAEMLIRRRRFQDLIRDGLLLNLPFFLLCAPYLLWKRAYYGSIYPNTYFAKAAHIPLWEQGFYYLGLYFRVYFTSALSLAALAAIPILWMRSRRTPPPPSEAAVSFPTPLLSTLRAFCSDRIVASILAAFLAVCVYLILFVAKVGGDFMYARFVIPVVPAMYFLIEALTRKLLPTRPNAVLLIYLALLALVPFERWSRHVLYPHDTIKNPTPDTMFQHRGVADEHYYYTAPINYNNTRSMIETGEIIGRFLRPFFEGLDATVLLSSENVIGYYGRFKICIEKNGLTDYFIARQPLTPEERRRVRTGHVKFYTYDYLIDRGVDLTLLYRPSFVRPFQQARFILPDKMEIPVCLITYDTRLIRELKRRGGKEFEFIDFEDYLDRYIATVLPALSPDQLRSDYKHFRDYYFRHNQDPAREAAFTEAPNKTGMSPKHPE